MRRFPNPKSETRDPKENRNPKLENIANGGSQPPIARRLYRISDFGLPSVFGFRYSDFPAGQAA
jgi:hypothetical protein